MSVTLRNFFVSIVFVFFFWTNKVNAVSYFIDNNGSDSNSGTSISSPWRTLDRINSQQFSPGDTIAFKRGGSWVGSIELTWSGTNGNPIVFTAYGSGAAPVLSNPCSGCYSNVFIVRSSWIVIKDLLIKDTHHAGIIMRNGSSNVTVSDNEITNTGIGVFLQTSNHVITRNNIHDLKMVVNNTSHPDDDYGANGIWLEKSDNNEISYNTCKNCRAPSYDYGYDGGFIEF